MRAIADRLTYANVVGTLALVIAVGGGVAYAANTVFSTDIVNNEVYSADVRNDNLAGGGLTAADLRAGSVRSSEVLDDQIRSADVRDDNLAGGGLTGADIKDQSGVDTCVLTVRIGQLCVRAENFARPWLEAMEHCANLDLRVPSLGEALELAQTHDIPNVDQNEGFWTDEYFADSSGESAWLVNDAGDFFTVAIDGAPAETVCVTTPTN